MPAFDPVRDAVLNSPVEQQSFSLASPLASPSLTRRATDLSVLLNSESAMPTSLNNSRRSSLSHLMAPQPEDKLSASEPLGRRYTGSSSKSSQAASYPAPIQASSQPQAQFKRESLSPTVYDRQHHHQDSRYLNSRPSSSSSTSTVNTNNVRTSGGPGSSGSVLKRQTSSPSMPPPPTPPMPNSAGSISGFKEEAPSAASVPAKSSIPYMPTKRLTPAGSVLKPLTTEEMEMYKNFQGQGALRLARKRKREGSDDSEAPSAKKFQGDVGVIAEHYNSRPDVGVVQRQTSPIIGLKSFNNWVKSVLITRFAHPILQQSNLIGYGRGRSGGGRGKVLDMGCGKGGDIMKWAKAKIKEILCVDIAAVSVDQARGRYLNMRSQFEASFAALDCFTEPLSSAFSPQQLSTPFDVVSMQFCMHYAFETEQKVRCMLDNVSRYMRPGGVFIGTIPNAEMLLSQLAMIPPEVEELKFGNGVYQIRFEKRQHDSYFGHKYWFYLQDAVDDVPEYIVYWDNFVSMAAEYGLYPTYKAEFHAVFTEFSEVEEFKELMVRMKVVDASGASAIDEEQWEATNIYIAFAFEKR